MNSIGKRIADFFRSLFSKQPKELPPPPEEIILDPSLMHGVKMDGDEDFAELLQTPTRPGPDDCFVNIDLVWDLDLYNSEIELIQNAADEHEARQLGIVHWNSESHTGYLSYDLMPHQARMIKDGRSEKEVELLVEVLRQELPELMEGKEPEAYELSWFTEDGTRQVLRYTPGVRDE